MEIVDNLSVKDLIQTKFGENILASYEPNGLLTLEITSDILLPLVEYIKSHEIKIDFLTDICGVHYPENKGTELTVVYHLHSFINNFRLRLKCFLPIENPKIQSLTPLYLGANWMERETYDFFGIQFIGHPDLRRILNMEEMEYHPMLKQYHLEDETREDKNDAMFGR